MKLTQLGRQAVISAGIVAVFYIAFVAVSTWVAVGHAAEIYDEVRMEGAGLLITGNAALPSPRPSTRTLSPWKRTKATFYGKPYDDGRRRVCADGKTVYASNGDFCATRLVPLGSMIEVRRGKVTLRLRVADTQAKRFGHLIDLPTGTWAKLGAPYKTGKVRVEWRKVR